MQAGNGFAKLLYGDEDFSGRLSVTVYKEVGDLHVKGLDRTQSFGGQTMLKGTVNNEK